MVRALKLIVHQTFLTVAFSEVYMQSLMFKQFAACNPGQGIDLALPTWYKGLPCENGVPQPDSLNGLWVIAANIVDIMLFIAGVLAVFYVVYGGIRLITSQGQPDRIAGARQMLIYAAAGLIVSIIARVLVQYVVQSILGSAAINTTGVE